MSKRSATSNLHRNNAAEWMMWVCLLPLFGMAVLWERIKCNRKGAKNAKADAKI